MVHYRSYQGTFPFHNAVNMYFIYYFIVNNKHHRMNKSYSEINSSAFTTRIKTDRMNTQTS